MRMQTPYVITISRQLGSGGAHIGRMLARELGIPYADRDILERAAQALQVRVEDIEQQDESVPTLLQTVLQALSVGVPEANCAPPLEVPSHAELRDAESLVIREIAARHGGVIVGRAGFHLLESHPRHFSVFLYADLAFRVRRVEKVYGLSCTHALRAIEHSDRSRRRYLFELTGREWTDATQYDVSLCTSTLGFMLASRMLCEAVRTHFRPC